MLLEESLENQFELGLAAMQQHIQRVICYTVVPFWRIDWAIGSIGILLH